MYIEGNVESRIIILFRQRDNKNKIIEYIFFFLEDVPFFLLWKE